MRLQTVLKEFYALFGKAGGDRLPGNVGISRTIVDLCYELIRAGQPVLFDYFDTWDARPATAEKPFGVEQALIRLGQWEGAWGLAQLHYDQYLRQEAAKRLRLPKGHPLCNLALVGRAIGSSSLVRHYALLASAGDVYWEHKLPSLKYGGLAPTMLEQFESRDKQNLWRATVRDELRSRNRDVPVYLESMFARRWFSQTHAKHITNMAQIKGRKGTPFVEVLLDTVEDSRGAPATITGTRFEAATGILLSATPGFEVDSARKTSDEQIDLVVSYLPDPLAQIGLERGPGLVECKSSKDRVGAKDLRDFGAKCLFHRVRFGIIVARAGLSGGLGKSGDAENAALVRRRFQLDGLTLLVLTIDQLRNRSLDLRGLADALAADYKDLFFGHVP